jgi:hypothetical protein
VIDCFLGIVLIHVLLYWAVRKPGGDWVGT